MGYRFSRRKLLAAVGGVALTSMGRTDALAHDVEGNNGGNANDAANHHARWIAGAAPLPSVEPSAEWKAYAQTENERWAQAQGRLKAMQDFGAREIGPLVPADHTLFYPFAGPDALHAIALFGTARRMHLVGLEPVGTLADPTKGAPAGYFARLGVAMADIHRLTFYRTHEMSTDFQREGVLAALVAAIVRQGGRVANVQTTSTLGPSAARIDWINAANQPRRLDYTQLDLANAGLKEQSKWIAALHDLAPYVTFVKAAMYLLPETRFATLRQTILDDSSIVIQDDTGLPFRYFDDRWATRLFGRYELPVTPFESKHQPDLQAAFEKRTATPLTFGIGYHVDARKSNLLIASKGRR